MVKKNSERFRDPVHGFIEISPLELQIINSIPFQRLREIHQLALTHFVFHGAEHTRFGHSLGVMHLVSRAFDAVTAKQPALFPNERKAWYRQLLRLIALTHDLGHPPYSHGPEGIFPDGIKHEDYTENIIKETKIGEIITEIGEKYKTEYGAEYDITPALVCDIYSGRATEPDFIFLRKFMDSELDCDKMDYLLRDSLFCGVTYGKYDLERLIGSLTVYKDKDDSQIRLAIDKGGIHAVEEFILARYFMFVQVYFHRTRRIFDNFLVKFLKDILPDGIFPQKTNDYLQWDDTKVWALIKNSIDINVNADRIFSRKLMKLIYESPPHSDVKDKQIHNLIYADIQKEFGKDHIFKDSADKLPHKIPTQYDITDEKAIPVIRPYSDIPVSLSSESEIIRALTKPINILRIYSEESIYSKVKAFCDQKRKEMLGYAGEDSS